MKIITIINEKTYKIPLLLSEKIVIFKGQDVAMDIRRSWFLTSDGDGKFFWKPFSL